MSDSFFGDVGEAISNIGSGISDFLTGGVGTDPNRLISSFRFMFSFIFYIFEIMWIIAYYHNNN
jgi:hypothetical protein